jgi:hypothetical protein
MLTSRSLEYGDVRDSTMTETRLALATDKQEITEVIYRFARAIDRCDKQLIASVFHPGATDDHGSFKSPYSKPCNLPSTLSPTY